MRSVMPSAFPEIGYAHHDREVVAQLPGPQDAAADRGLAVVAAHRAHDHDRSGNRAVVVGLQGELAPDALDVGEVPAQPVVAAVRAGAAGGARGGLDVDLAVG